MDNDNCGLVNRQLCYIVYVHVFLEILLVKLTSLTEKGSYLHDKTSTKVDKSMSIKHFGKTQ